MQIQYTKNKEELSQIRSNILLNPEQLKKNIEHTNEMNLKLEMNIKSLKMDILELNDQALNQNKKIDDYKRLQEWYSIENSNLKAKLSSINAKTQNLQARESEFDHIKDRLEFILRDIKI